MKYYMQNSNTDCGAACLAMILNYYKINTTIIELRELLNTNINGTSIHNILSTSHKFGLNSYGIRCDELPKNNEVLPVIAQINLDYSKHFVVIYSIKKDHIVIADPLHGKVKMSYKKFYEVWNKILIIFEKNYELSTNIELNKRNKHIIKQVLVNVANWSILHYILIAVIQMIILFASLHLFNSLLISFVLYENSNRLILFFTVIILLYFMALVVKERVSLYVKSRYKKNIFKIELRRLISLKATFYSNRYFYENFKISKEISNVRENVINDLLIIIDFIIILTIFYINILIIDKTFAFLNVLFIAICTILMTILNYINYRSNEGKRYCNNSIDKKIIEIMEGINDIKINYSEAALEADFKRVFSETLQKKKIVESRYKTLNLVFKLLSMITALIFIYFLSVLLRNEQISVNHLALLIVITYILSYYINNTMTAFKNILNIITDIQKIDGIFNLGKDLDYNDEIQKTNIDKISDIQITSTEEEIEFIFREGNTYYISNSDLIKNLLTIKNDNEIQVKINGFNLNDINKNKYRYSIGYVSNDIFFFEDTVFNNFSNCLDLDDDFAHVIKVFKKMNIDEMISNKPKKYKTVIDKNGINFTKQELYLLAVSRAILYKPSLLILENVPSKIGEFQELIILLREINPNMVIINASDLCHNYEYSRHY